MLILQHRCGFGVTMFTVLRAAVLLIAVIVAAPSVASGVVFQNLSVGKAFARAEAEGKLVLVYYATSWCPPCRVLEATTFEDSEVAACIAEHAVAVRVDGDHARGLAARFDIGRYPSLVFIGADRQILDRIVGAISAPEFLAFTANVLAGHYAVHRAGTDAARHTDAAPHTEAYSISPFAQVSTITRAVAGSSARSRSPSLTALRTKVRSAARSASRNVCSPV